MPKNTGIVLKLDFEKVYDKVNSDKKDPNKWTVSVKINNIIGHYFQSHKGDPLSHFLFNLVVECLAKMVMTAKKTTFWLDWLLTC